MKYRYWEDIDNVRTFLDYAAKQLGIRELQDWYQVTQQQLISLGAGKDNCWMIPYINFIIITFVCLLNVSLTRYCSTDRSMEKFVSDEFVAQHNAMLT